MRSSWDRDESKLSPALVGASDFGLQFSTALPAVPGTTLNKIYAQPIVAAGVVIAATEENEVVGLDAITGNIKWSKVLGPSWPAATVACGDLIPDIWITGTPVYDPATTAVYVVAKTNDGPDVEHPNYRMHALDLTTGAEKAGWPVVIAGNPTNGGPAFVPRTANQRPARWVAG
jgi:outer membrane protein assembly factor BamB